MTIQAVIFDLDGVIVSTDEYHYLAWSELAEKLGIPFDRERNELLRGVSRMESLDIILESSSHSYSRAEKEALAERKNSRYRELLQELSAKDILPGVKTVLQALKNHGIRTAIGSSSKNTPVILSRIGLENAFDAVADGNEITNSKPDPEVFLLAAHKLGVTPRCCLVVEDADAGIEAARAAGMQALGVASASNNRRAHYTLPDLSQFQIESIL